MIDWKIPAALGVLLCGGGLVLYAEWARGTVWAWPMLLLSVCGLGLLLIGRTIMEDGSATKGRVVYFMLRGVAAAVGGSVLWGLVAALFKALG